MTKRAILVVANGEPPSSNLLHHLAQEHKQLVAVDGGLYTCIKYGLEPQILIGDFDSISDEERKKFSYIHQIHTPDQNKSDLEKTVEYFLEEGEKMIICGALGRRIDHTLVNMLLLCRYPEKVIFVTDHEACFALKKSTQINCNIGQTLSLIPLSTHVKGVITKGLKWELNHATLNKQYASISNICLETSISIVFESGDLIACLGNV